MCVVFVRISYFARYLYRRFLTPTNSDDIKRFKKELSVFMNMVYIPENQKASFWEDIAVVEDNSFLDEVSVQ